MQKVAVILYIIFHVTFSIFSTEMDVHSQICYHVAHYSFIVTMLFVAVEGSRAIDLFLYAAILIFIGNILLELTCWNYDLVEYAESNFISYRLDSFALSIGLILAILSFKKIKQRCQQLKNV